MGRPPKPTAQHKLEGTFRADRHGDRLDASWDSPRIRAHAPPEPDEREFQIGIDVEFVPKMLVGVYALARCFDVNESSIRRWAREGSMPAPRTVGGRRLWSADELREWIRRGCPDLRGKR